MKNRILLLSAIILGLSLMSFTGEKTKKILFFGDSITEMGVQPGGYIAVLKDNLKKKGIAENYEIVGAGIGGNKIYDLFLRLEKDVLAQKPDVVVIYIGVNDVWHKAWGTGTDYDKFGKFYDAVVKKIQAQGAKVVLATPAAIGEKHDYSNAQDGDLNAYSNWIRAYANEHHLGLVDLRKIFHDYSLANNPKNEAKDILTTDGVHLNEKGNKLVADLMWEAVK